MKKSKKSTHKIILTILLGLVISFFIVIFDFYNIPTLLGVDVSKLNFDALSLIIGNLLVVVIFIITYFIVDSRDVKKDNNQKEVAYLLLKNTYEYCLIMINPFYNDDYRESYAKTEHRDKSKLEAEINQISEMPFTNSNMIFELAASGVIDKETFEEYLDIKNGFQDFIFIATSTFDSDNDYYDFLDVAQHMENKIRSEKFRLIDCYNKK